MPSAPVFLSHPSSLEHDTAGHPERAERMIAIERELTAHDSLALERLSSPAVERSTLEAVHAARYVEWVEQRSTEYAHLDPDTVVSPGSFEAALHGCGGAVRLVDLLLDGAARTGFSAHRPPGHHAEVSRAGGFCLFNHAAVAARHALERHELDRVLIFDWDVHHGNGTNDIFHESDQVLYISIHQSPLYPGTGPPSDVGAGDGEGFTVNLPVSPGADDALFASLVDHVVVPVSLSFAPQLVLISAGYDAHREDPLGSCLVTDAGFRTMATTVMALGAELGAPVGAVLEGGYAVDALARSVVETLAVMAAPPQELDTERAPIDSRAAEARRYFSRWWPTLEGP